MTLLVLPGLLLLWCWLMYGLLHLRWQNPRLADPDASLQRACKAAARGHWEPAAQLFEETGQDWERRSLYAQRLGGVAAAGRDRWLKAWEEARPEDPAARSWQRVPEFRTRGRCEVGRPRGTHREAGSRDSIGSCTPPGTISSGLRR
ncbi:hypothetical protein GCM10010378_07200 [Streptomyces viridochromogenes]